MAFPAFIVIKMLKKLKAFKKLLIKKESAEESDDWESLEGKSDETFEGNAEEWEI